LNNINNLTIKFNIINLKLLSAVSVSINEMSAKYFKRTYHMVLNKIH